MVMLNIVNGDKEYTPIVAGDIKWSTERAGVPGSLTFDVVKNGELNFHEGNLVKLCVDKTPVFLGYVFQKKRSKGDIISVTAYDQLRYLKNKDSFIFEKLTATEFIHRVAKYFSVERGEIADTQYIIEKGVLDNKTLFDMIQEVLDTTLMNTKKLYVLYDDFGKLALKNIEDMKLDILLDEKTAENFDYVSSIDGETYNQIKIAFDSKKKKGLQDGVMVQDEENIKKWGVLQYYEKSKTEVGVKEKANALLDLYNRKTRTLSIKNAFGSPNVRAGCSLRVALKLGDINVNHYFVCEKVTHTFREDMHLMDLTLRGGDILV